MELLGEKLHNGKANVDFDAINLWLVEDEKVKFNELTKNKTEADKEWSKKNNVTTLPAIRLYTSKDSFKEFKIDPAKNMFGVQPERAGEIEAFLKENGVKFN